MPDVNAILVPVLLGVTLLGLLAAGARHDRIERKLDLVLRNLGVEPPPLPERVKDLARDPSRKIEAIKVYREETGAGLRDAKEAVEAWMATQA